MTVAPSSVALSVADLLADGIRYERGGVAARALECFEQAAARIGENPAAAAEAWWRIANLHRLHSAWDDAVAAANRAADLARRHGLVDVEANALNIEGAVWMHRGEFDRARELFTRMLGLSANPATRAKALQNLGNVAAEDGNLDEGERLFSQSRSTYREAGDARGEANSLLNLGILQTVRGDPAQARETLEQAVNGARLSGDLEMHAAALMQLGIALGNMGIVGEAEERITTAYGQFTIADIPLQRVLCLMQLAKLAADRHESAGARVCLMHARTVAVAASLPRELKTIEDRLARLEVKD